MPEPASADSAERMSGLLPSHMQPARGARRRRTDVGGASRSKPPSDRRLGRGMLAPHHHHHLHRTGGPRPRTRASHVRAAVCPATPGPRGGPQTTRPVSPAQCALSEETLTIMSVAAAGLTHTRCGPKARHCVPAERTERPPCGARVVRRARTGAISRVRRSRRGPGKRMRPDGGPKTGRSKQAGGP